LPVPSGIHVHAARRPSSVPRLRQGSARAASGAPSCGRRRGYPGESRVKLLNREIGGRNPFFLIAGPDTLESGQLELDVAGHVKAIADKLGILYVFKGSFDKANRSSHKSYRGPGLEGGLKIMESVKQQIGVPVLTDVHEDTP